MIRPDTSLAPTDQAQDRKTAETSKTKHTPRTVREKAGLTEAEMAGLIGMSEFAYREWEKGTRRPGGPAFKLLALLDAQPRDMVARLQENV